MSVDALRSASLVAASGLSAQSVRLRVVAENVANAETTGTAPGMEPYRRKIVSFQAETQRITGLSRVTVDRIERDPSAFRIETDPGHPAADAAGHVKYPNVSTLIELADMREAARAYEANLQIIKQVREISNMQIDLLRT